MTQQPLKIKKYYENNKWNGGYIASIGKKQYYINPEKLMIKEVEYVNLFDKSKRVKV